MNTRATTVVGYVVSYAVRFVSKESLWVCPCIRYRCEATAWQTHSSGNEELLQTSFSMRSVSFQRKVYDLFLPELLVTKGVVIFPGATLEACCWFISISYSIFPNDCYALWSSESITHGMELIQPLSRLGEWWTQNKSDHQISASKDENGDLSIIRNMSGESAIQYLFSLSRNASPHQPLYKWIAALKPAVNSNLLHACFFTQ